MKKPAPFHTLSSLVRRAVRAIYSDMAEGGHCVTAQHAFVCPECCAGRSCDGDRAPLPWRLDALTAAGDWIDAHREHAAECRAAWGRFTASLEAS